MCRICSIALRGFRGSRARLRGLTDPQINYFSVSGFGFQVYQGSGLLGGFGLGISGVGFIRGFGGYSLFFTHVTGSRRSLSLKLSDTKGYEPQIRARLGTTAHFCRVVVRGVTRALPFWMSRVQSERSYLAHKKQPPPLGPYAQYYCRVLGGRCFL